MSIIQKMSDWKIRNPSKIPNWPKRLAFRLLRATQSMRCMPDYCIIGAQKSGTTSLYSYLALHPQVKPSFVKEIHYYNDHYAKGRKWYRAHFPLGPLDCNKRNFITGEASTMYLHDSASAVRMFEDVPSIKLLLVLRNPVDRAVSHYHHRIRSGRETRSFEDAMSSALSNARAGKFMSGTETDYLLYGCYAKDIRHWLEVFPGEQLRVLQAEALFKDPAPIFKEVSDFLGIEYLESASSRKFNSGGYSKDPVSLRSELEEYFHPFNAELYQLPSVKFKWD